MFTGLTNFLFGCKETDQNSELFDTNNRTIKALNTKEDSDGWILVSKTTKKNQPGEFFDDSEDEDDLETSKRLMLEISCDFEMGRDTSPSPTAPAVSTTPSTPSSLTQLDPDGSWYLTPPPCFTAGNSTSSITVVSPMENLLIEHPSMSVYRRSDIDEIHDDDEDVSTDPPMILVTKVLPNSQEAGSSPVTVQRQVPHHGSRSGASGTPGVLIAELYDKGAALTTSRQKKLERRKTKCVLQPNQMERSNKARAYASGSKNKRRKDHMKNPSGVNNNRKC